MIDLVQGEILEVLKSVPDNTYSAILADPPYALTANKKGGTGVASINLNHPAGRSRIGTGNGPGGFMGHAWDSEIPSKELWSEILRTCKPGAPLLAFGGTRTFHRLVVNIEDGGWEIRDTLCWLHAQGFPKSSNVSKQLDKRAGAKRPVVGYSNINVYENGKNHKFYSGDEGNPAYHKAEITAPATADAALWDGYGTALKPAHEPIVLARKPPDCKNMYENALKWGVGPLAIDPCRIYRDPDDKSGWSQTGSEASENRAMTGANYARDPKPDNPGRWPSNVLLDEEAAALLDVMVGDRPGGRPVPAKTKSKPIWGNAGRQAFEGYNDNGGPSRFYFCAKSSVKERGKYNDHSCVKPLALTEYLAKLILPPNPDEHMILVPFSGSGSEIIGAWRAGWRNIVGIEREPEYVEIARRRIDEACASS